MVENKKVGVKSAAKPVAAKAAPVEKPKQKPAKRAPHVAAPVPAQQVAAAPAMLSPAAPAKLEAVRQFDTVAKLEAPAIGEVSAVAEALPLKAPVEALTSVAPKATALRQAMGEAVNASAHGALAVNDKVIEALQTQSHAVLDLWRSAVSAPHLSDALRLQSSGAREAYETAQAQWKDIAATTAHWFNKTVEPLSSAISGLKR